MSEARRIRAVKGVRDILPPESALWNWFEAAARRVMESYGYQEIRLPIFEETELFARSVGADTDIVSKEMYGVIESPGAAELEALREVVRGAFESYIRDSSSVLWFELSLWKFIQQVGDAVQHDRVSLGPKARSDFDSIKEQFNEFARLDNQVKQTQTARELATQLRLSLDLLRFGERFSMRPEATASVCRAYIEHGMHTWPGDVKLYYVGPMFRRERPQKGRYRQFYQIGAEVLGQSDHPAIDAELIEMLTVLLAECKIEKTSLLVNSIGCRECRPKYVAALRGALEDVKAQMCGDCQRRIETNPLRVLDCKVEADQPIIEKLPSITEHLCEACRQHFSELQRQLKLRDITFTIAPRLVRGLDYYMRTTFEITSPALGAQNALVGGGRYDGLVELLGGQPTKGIGFALGTDRFIEVMKEAGKITADLRPDVFVAWLGEAAYPTAVKLARQLRSAGFVVELPAEEMKLKKSLGLADKLSARYALIIGENEIAAGRYALKRLADAQQRELTEGELIEFLKGERKVASGE